MCVGSEFQVDGAGPLWKSSKSSHPKVQVEGDWARWLSNVPAAWPAYVRLGHYSLHLPFRELRGHRPSDADTTRELFFHSVADCVQSCICSTIQPSTVTGTVTGTAGVKKSLLGLDSWIAAAEEVSLQTASEGRKRRCRRDVLRQTVPNTGCSDWKGPVERMTR